MAQGEAKIVAGRYRLQRPLGRGGMGVVWHAHDTLLGRDVAVKEIYLPTAGTEPVDSSDPVLRRALREARAAANLRHPAIITVHDVATDEGRPWIVMELIDGRSLADAVRAQGLLTEQRAAEIGLKVLDALRAAHRQGVLHRDVKPANILLDGDRVVLTDFGIASVDGATELTATGQLVGSPAYLAPERINGRPATEAADLWALGVTLYAAITGRSPFHREDTQATLAAVLTSRPDPPAHAGLLWPVIKGMLVKDPAQRLSANQAAPLLAAVADLPTTVQPATTPSGRGRPRWWRTRPRCRTTDDDLTRTAVAPPPTVAAPTAAQQAEPATLAAPTEVRPGATTASTKVTMSDQVRTTELTPYKPTAAESAALGRLRGQAIAGALAGVAVVVVAVFVGIQLSDNDSPAVNAPPGAGAPASGEPQPAEPADPQAQLDPALQTKPEVTAGKGDVTELKVILVIKGTGPVVKAGQQLAVNYVGVTYKDGKEFDSSWKRGQPAQFPVGVGDLIKGWDEGLVGVPVGSRVQLDIPADMAYGEQTTAGRPAGDLRFVIDILRAWVSRLRVIRELAKPALGS